MLKLFGYRNEHDYGITCGLVIAESEEEAKKIIGPINAFETVTLIHIPLKKGYTYIGDYDE